MLGAGLAGGLLAGRGAVAGPAAQAHYQPERTEVWDFTARSGRRYRILLSWPPGEAPAQGWPVLYALDGNAMFPLLTGACRLLPDTAQGVIVAIDFPLDDAEPERRDFEYTPPAPDAPGRNGGADALLAIMEREVKPAVEAAFRIDRARQALFGHSYGGLFTLHALFTRPAGFSTWLAASPSIWWGEGLLLRESEGFAAHPPPPGPVPRLLMTFGSLEGRMRARPGRVMGENVRRMAARLEALRGRFAALSVQEFQDENHGSVRAAAAGRAVPFAFTG
ncbi:alpha/beta hydrolase [Roseomonas marmotae]|nr:alpha/beta hydrolase-fold protein [Roseomonas marmotae]QTI79328.1 alpha/beta hydrolase [Roseomonas marmotae]